MDAGKAITRVNWLDYIDCTEVRGSIVQSGPWGIDCLTIPPEHQERLRSRIGEVGPCPYCGERLISRHDDETVSSTIYAELLVSCDLCGFWRMAQADSLMGRYWKVPYARGFQPELQTPALRELAREVQQSPERIYSLEPLKFEVLVGGILGEFFDCEVRHVGRTGDGGVDLLVLDADDPLLVQVKRRTRADAVEGVEVVKHLFASVYAAGRNRGMLVTSAQRFTRGAKAWVRLPALRDSGFVLDLIDMARVMDMTRSTTRDPAPAWQRFLDRWQSLSIGLPQTGMESRVDDDELVVTSADLPGVRYIFVRADRDCCTIVEDGEASGPQAMPPEQGSPTRSIGGVEYTELIGSWPLSITDEVLAFLAGPADEMRVPVEP